MYDDWKCGNLRKDKPLLLPCELCGSGARTLTLIRYMGDNMNVCPDCVADELEDDEKLT